MIDQDRGYYVCTASNIVGTGTSQTTFLDVTGSKYVKQRWKSRNN
jgi:hypothetical protein